MNNSNIILVTFVSEANKWADEIEFFVVIFFSVNFGYGKEVPSYIQIWLYFHLLQNVLKTEIYR